MILDVYDSDFTRLGLIESISSLIWTRRYWSAGGFKLLVPATTKHLELLTKNRWVVRQDDSEVGEIRYIDIKRDRQGMETLEVQGRFLSAWLGKRLVLNQIITTAKTQDILVRLAAENVVSPTDSARAIHGIHLSDVSAIQRDPISYTSEYMATVLDACESAAKASKLGFRITTDVSHKKHYFDVFVGRDLTEGNGLYRPCIFAPDSDNILSQEFTNSIENLRTSAYVAGEEADGVPRRVVEVGEPAAGLKRHEVFIDAGDIPQSYLDEQAQEVVIAPNEYGDMLAQRGESELSHYTESLSFRSKVNTGSKGLVYKRDYDIGDRVTCINRDWMVKIDVRITEIAEIYQSNPPLTLDITFGESLPTLLETIRQVRK